MKQNFKSTFSLVEMLVCVAIIGLFVALALPALADSDNGSFGPTNNLVSGTQYTLYPTNSSGSGTGKGVDIQNYKTVGLYLSGDVINSNSAPIGFSLVRADKLNPVGVTNWETTAVYKFLVTVPAQTNHFDWVTNLPEDCAGPAFKLGLSQLTNNFTTGCNISNLDIGVVKKIVPIRFP